MLCEDLERKILSYMDKNNFSFEESYVVPAHLMVRALIIFELTLNVEYFFVNRALLYRSLTLKFLYSCLYLLGHPVPQSDRGY